MLTGGTGFLPSFTGLNVVETVLVIFVPCCLFLQGIHFSKVFDWIFLIEFRRSIFISLLYFSTVFIQFESGGSPFRFVRFSFSLFIFCCCRIVESFPSKTVAVFFRPRRLTRHGRFPFDVGASIYISGRASFLVCFFLFRPFRTLFFQQLWVFLSISMSRISSRRSWQSISWTWVGLASFLPAITGFYLVLLGLYGVYLVLLSLH